MMLLWLRRAIFGANVLQLVVVLIAIVIVGFQPGKAHILVIERKPPVFADVVCGIAAEHPAITAPASVRHRLPFPLHFLDRLDAQQRETIAN